MGHIESLILTLGTVSKSYSACMTQNKLKKPSYQFCNRDAAINWKCNRFTAAIIS